MKRTKQLDHTKIYDKSDPANRYPFHLTQDTKSCIVKELKLTLKHMQADEFDHAQRRISHLDCVLHAYGFDGNN